MFSKVSVITRLCLRIGVMIATCPVGWMVNCGEARHSVMM